MKFETKRLILRPIKKSDWKDIVEGANDLKVTSMLAVVAYPYKKKDAFSWINSKLKEEKGKKRKDYVFVIELKSEKKVIGATGIHNISYQDLKCTTGSWINRKYWRQGYILEAKIPILDFIFNKLKLRKVETGAFLENKASQGMSLKLGFKKEGLKRKAVICKADGKVRDEVIFGIFKNEWLKVRPKLVKELKERFG